MDELVNRQWAPYPHDLEQICSSCKTPPEITKVFLIEEVRDPESRFKSGEAGGLTLEVWVDSPDSYGKTDHRRVRHLFPVPCATFNLQSWTRWLFDRLVDVRMHELGEYFEVDGVKPYAPLHGPGDNPYVVHELATQLQRDTAYTGEVNSH